MSRPVCPALCSIEKKIPNAVIPPIRGKYVCPGTVRFFFFLFPFSVFFLNSSPSNLFIFIFFLVEVSFPLILSIFFSCFLFLFSIHLFILVYFFIFVPYKVHFYSWPYSVLFFLFRGICFSYFRKLVPQIILFLHVYFCSLWSLFFVLGCVAFCFFIQRDLFLLF
jgi:hypothetical protein